MNVIVLYLPVLLGVSCVAKHVSIYIDEEGVKEKNCFQLNPEPTIIDLAWMSTVEYWHFVMWSRLDLYRSARDALDTEIGKVPYAILSKPCLICNKKCECSGFGRKPAWDVTVDEKGVFHFKGQSNHSLAATHTLGLTDNKHFVVGITCWDDGQASYSVWVPNHLPLPYAIKDQILEYLQKLDFDLKYFIETPCSSEPVEIPGWDPKLDQ